jgi:uncharacterized protein (DUF1501 family)
MNLSRRTFIQGCCAGIAAMSGARFNNAVFARPDARRSSADRDILVSVFLRGGMDALSFLVPHLSQADYETARTRLKLTPAQTLALDANFGLHPSAQLLKDLYDSQKLALVCAAGSPDPTRSHFEAMDRIERGKPLDPGFSGSGWLGRYMSAFTDDAIFRAVSQGSSLATAWEGYGRTLAMAGAGDLGLNAYWNQQDDYRRALRRMYLDHPSFKDTARQLLAAIDILEAADPGSYVPSSPYPDRPFPNQLKALAQIIKLDVGLSAATVDFGGWDTHDGQINYNSPTTGWFADNISDLAAGLYHFWNDLSAYQNRLTVVVMTEFGRRLRENDNRGTDHGHGGVMMVLSNHLAQKKVWGVWPGLDSANLFENVDLRVTTDFRTVLSEILLARCGMPDIRNIFPGYDYHAVPAPERPGLFGAIGRAGDVNLDGRTTPEDARLAFEASLANITLSPEQMANADLCPPGGNGVITPQDAQAIMNVHLQRNIGSLCD